MQQYPLEKQHWEQGKTERAVTKFEREVEELKLKLAKNDGKPLSPQEQLAITNRLNAQLNQLKVIGCIEACLDKFRSKSETMKERELRWESHQSKRLGNNLRYSGKPSPDSRCHAHAIIAGSDPDAGKLRGMLAVFGIRVDDAVNGVWLPGYEKDIPHWSMPNAVCHAWLNHSGYHEWLRDRMFPASIVTFAGNNNAEVVREKARIMIAVLQKVSVMLQGKGEKVPSTAIRTKVDTERLRNQKK